MNTYLVTNQSLLRLLRQPPFFSSSAQDIFLGCGYAKQSRNALCHGCNLIRFTKFYWFRDFLMSTSNRFTSDKNKFAFKLIGGTFSESEYAI